MSSPEKSKKISSDIPVSENTGSGSNNNSNDKNTDQVHTINTNNGIYFHSHNQRNDQNEERGKLTKNFYPNKSSQSSRNVSKYPYDRDGSSGHHERHQNYRSSIPNTQGYNSSERTVPQTDDVSRSQPKNLQRKQTIRDDSYPGNQVLTFGSKTNIKILDGDVIEYEYVDKPTEVHVTHNHDNDNNGSHRNNYNENIGRPPHSGSYQMKPRAGFSHNNVNDNVSIHFPTQSHRNLTQENQVRLPKNKSATEDFNVVPVLESGSDSKPEEKTEEKPIVTIKTEIKMDNEENNNEKNSESNADKVSKTDKDVLLQKKENDDQTDDINKIVPKVNTESVKDLASEQVTDVTEETGETPGNKSNLSTHDDEKQLKINTNEEGRPVSDETNKIESNPDKVQETENNDAKLGDNDKQENSATQPVHSERYFRLKRAYKNSDVRRLLHLENPESEVLGANLVNDLNQGYYTPEFILNAMKKIRLEDLIDLKLYKPVDEEKREPFLLMIGVEAKQAYSIDTISSEYSQTRVMKIAKDSFENATREVNLVLNKVSESNIEQSAKSICAVMKKLNDESPDDYNRLYKQQSGILEMIYEKACLEKNCSQIYSALIGLFSKKTDFMEEYKPFNALCNNTPDSIVKQILSNKLYKRCWVNRAKNHDVNLARVFVRRVFESAIQSECIGTRKNKFADINEDMTLSYEEQENRKELRIQKIYGNVLFITGLFGEGIITENFLLRATRSYFSQNIMQNFIYLIRDNLGKLFMFMLLCKKYPYMNEVWDYNKVRFLGKDLTMDSIDPLDAKEVSLSILRVGSMKYHEFKRGILVNELTKSFIKCIHKETKCDYEHINKKYIDEIILDRIKQKHSDLDLEKGISCKLLVPEYKAYLEELINKDCYVVANTKNARADGFGPYIWRFEYLKAVYDFIILLKDKLVIKNEKVYERAKDIEDHILKTLEFGGDFLAMRIRYFMENSKDILRNILKKWEDDEPKRIKELNAKAQASDKVEKSNLSNTDACTMKMQKENPRGVQSTSNNNIPVNKENKVGKPKFSFDNVSPKEPKTTHNNNNNSNNNNNNNNNNEEDRRQSSTLRPETDSSKFENRNSNRRYHNEDKENNEHGDNLIKKTRTQGQEFNRSDRKSPSNRYDEKRDQPSEIKTDSGKRYAAGLGRDLRGKAENIKTNERNEKTNYNHQKREDHSLGNEADSGMRPRDQKTNSSKNRRDEKHDSTQSILYDSLEKLIQNKDNLEETLAKLINDDSQVVIFVEKSIKGYKDVIDRITNEINEKQRDTRQKTTKQRDPKGILSDIIQSLIRYINKKPTRETRNDRPQGKEKIHEIFRRALTPLSPEDEEVYNFVVSICVDLARNNVFSPGFGLILMTDYLKFCKLARESVKDLIKDIGKQNIFNFLHKYIGSLSGRKGFMEKLLQNDGEKFLTELCTLNRECSEPVIDFVMREFKSNMKDEQYKELVVPLFMKVVSKSAVSRLGGDKIILGSNVANFGESAYAACLLQEAIKCGEESRKAKLSALEDLWRKRVVEKDREEILANLFETAYDTFAQAPKTSSKSNRQKVECYAKLIDELLSSNITNRSTLDFISLKRPEAEAAFKEALKLKGHDGKRQFDREHGGASQRPHATRGRQGDGSRANGGDNRK